jgi:hypothetical protein
MGQTITYLRIGIVREEISAVDKPSGPRFSTLLFDRDVASLKRCRYNLWLLGFNPSSASLAALWTGQLASTQCIVRLRGGHHTILPLLLVLPLNSDKGLTRPHNSHVISVRWPAECSRQVIPELAALMRDRPVWLLRARRC